MNSDEFFRHPENSRTFLTWHKKQTEKEQQIVMTTEVADRMGGSDTNQNPSQVDLTFIPQEIQLQIFSFLPIVP